jgi:hypothetical protein
MNHATPISISFKPSHFKPNHFKTIRLPLAATLSVALLLAACKKEQSTATEQTQPSTPVVAQTQPAPVELKDVIENDPRYILGISYAPNAAKYPVLASELQRYADAARQDLMKAVAESDPKKLAVPFDLTLSFTLQAETPQIVAVAADGSSFLGGAHSVPIIARFVWLPQENKMLRADALLADPAGWGPISDYVREQLHAALSQRVDADELPAEERAELMRSVGKAIDSGTEPKPIAFRWFEPVMMPEGGKIMALRFVFPPYQVGPYVDGTRSVEVPAAILMPHLAPEYRAMFTTEAPPRLAPMPAPSMDLPPQLDAPASGG